MKEVFLFRIKYIYIGLSLLALLIGSKLFFLQVLEREAFREKAEGQYISPVSEEFNRGFIYWRQKNGLPLGAATIRVGYTVAINPKKIDDASALFIRLKEFLPNLDEKTFLLKAGKKDDPYEEIARRVPKEDALALEGLLGGVSIYREKWRFYPGSTLGAHVLGFVGSNGGESRGQYGVERYYNDTLTRGEKNLYINFFAEVFANIKQSLFYESAREGDVVLSLEPEVERYTENLLEELQSKWNFKVGGVIIMNPHDGSIYAMAARPTFDPNTFQEEKDYSIFSNPLVEDLYEMGSIMKPLTMAAGLDSGAIRRGSTYTDTVGRLTIDGKTIGNYDGKGRGTVPMQEILNQSLNTGAVYIMRQTGKEKFAQYFLDFGLGEETGIDLPNEIPGLVQNLKSPREVEYATASFGQGIAMTPIAITRALASLANGGVLVTPHIGESIEYDLGISRKISYGGEKQVITKETAEEVTRMLVAVVDDALLGGTVKLPRYSVAAKTGTAQVSDKEGGGYYTDRFLHSFFGYFPAFDPKFLVFLYMMEPQGARYASETLTLPFMDISKFLIHYYEIPPDR